MLRDVTELGSVHSHAERGNEEGGAAARKFMGFSEVLSQTRVLLGGFGILEFGHWNLFGFWCL
jgi:hypothetical protein